MEKYGRAEAFFEVLNANGVDSIFINPGLDTTPIQAANFRYATLGKRAPKLILCLDESVALSAAHGNYMVTGKPQVVLVHAELGTLQMGGSLVNAQWGRAPIILFAGEFPDTERVTWLQKPYDQASIVRNSVKWDHKLDTSENFHEVLQKTFQIACSDPCGPVYLIHPLGFLNGEIDKETILPLPRDAASSVASVDVDNLSMIAGILVEAKNPIIVTGFSGRHAQSVGKLIELAETLGAPVLTGPQRMNFPTTHPLCAGIEKGIAKRPNLHITDADVVLVIDYDMQYAPAMEVPGRDAKIIHIGVDPTTQGRPLWGRGADIFIKADSREAIPTLKEMVNKKLTVEKSTANCRRFKQLESQHKRQRDEYHALAIKSAKQKPISPDWLARCIADVVDEDMIIVHNVISHFESVAEQISRSKPGTLLGSAGGSINWALGAALGVKLAAPAKKVVSLITGGGFVCGCPVATLLSARSYHAPFLSVIFNNQTYGATESDVKMICGDNLSEKMVFVAGVDIAPSLDYAAIAQACGAYGRMVEDPDDVIPALKEGLAQVLRGKAAVLDVRLERG